MYSIREQDDGKNIARERSRFQHMVSKVSFQVVEENLCDVRDEAIAALGANRTVTVSEQRFDWLYRDNPDGEAVLWSVREISTGAMAGFTVCLPRRISMDGQNQLAWNGADFSIYKKYRTLGVAIKLRRAAKEAIDNGRADFLYAHPNARMRLIHERVGHKQIGTMVRLAKPLRLEPYLEARLGNDRATSKIAAKVGGAVAAIGLRICSLEQRHRPRHQTHVVQNASFDERFDELWSRATKVKTIYGVRDARYLQWRYYQNPLYQTDAVLAEDGNQLAGFLLFTVVDDVVQIKDVFVANDESALMDLLTELIRHARRCGYSSISMIVMEGNPVESTLRRFGFVRRDDCSEMYGYMPGRSQLGSIAYDSRNWYVTVGDRDV